MKNPGHFGRGAGSDRKSTHFFNTRPAIGFAITLRTISEITARRLLAAEIGQALGGRKSGWGGRKPKQAHILIAIAKFARLFHTPAQARPHFNCGSYAEITPSRKGIRILRPGDGG